MTPEAIRKLNREWKEYCTCMLGKIKKLVRGGKGSMDTDREYPRIDVKPPAVKMENFRIDAR